MTILPSDLAISIRKRVDSLQEALVVCLFRYDEAVENNVPTRAERYREVLWHLAKHAERYE